MSIQPKILMMPEGKPLPEDRERAYWKIPVPEGFVEDGNPRIPAGGEWFMSKFDGSPVNDDGFSDGYTHVQFGNGIPVPIGDVADMKRRILKKTSCKG